MRPFRYPKSVPVMREPPDETLLSGRRPPGREGSLQVGVMMGNDRKTFRKMRNTLTGLFFFFAEGCTRVRAIVGGGGGGGVDGAVGSPITGSAMGG